MASCAVAFSGGIDSTVVAKAAQLALGNAAVAVTGTSASLADGELDEARRPGPIDWHSPRGARHRRVRESRLRAQRARPLLPLQDRALHAKSRTLAERLGVAVILNGANLDDLGDYRPGMQAAGEHRVASPLAECGFRKSDVRALAAEWESAHLGQAGHALLEQPRGLRRGSHARAAGDDRPGRAMSARAKGLRTLRVRYHKGDLARLEVPLDALAGLCEPSVREELLAATESHSASSTSRLTWKVFARAA